jgi:hypothetical protein
MQLRFIGCRLFLFWETAEIDGTLEHLEHSQQINDLPHCNMEHFLEHWNIKDLAHVPRIINDLQSPTKSVGHRVIAIRF